MTLTTTHNQASYTATGTVAIFTYDFLVLTAAELAVYLDGVKQVSGYTVSGVGLGSGGNVTFTTAPTAGVEVALVRITDQTQQVNFIEGDKLPAESLEGVLDRAYAAIQDLAGTVSRAVMLPPGSDLDDVVLPLPGALEFIRWNAAGTALETAAFAVLEGGTVDPTLGRINFGDGATSLLGDAALRWDNLTESLRLGLGTMPVAPVAGETIFGAADLSGAGGGFYWIPEVPDLVMQLGAVQQNLLPISGLKIGTGFDHQSFVLAPGDPPGITTGNTGTSAFEIRVGDSNLHVGPGRVALTGSSLLVGSGWASEGERIIGMVEGFMPTAGRPDTAWLGTVNEGVPLTCGMVLMEESGTTLRLGGVLSALRHVGAPAVDIVNTAAETSIFGGPRTIKAHTFGTFRRLRLELTGDFLAGGVGAAGLTVRVKLGGTTILTLTPVNYANNPTTRYGWILRTWIAAAGTPAAQVAYGRFEGSSAAGVTGASLAQATGVVSIHTALTVNTAVDQLYDITIQNTAAHASVSARVFSVIPLLE